MLSAVAIKWGGLCVCTQKNRWNFWKSVNFLPYYLPPYWGDRIKLSWRGCILGFSFGYLLRGCDAIKSRSVDYLECYQETIWRKRMSKQSVIRPPWYGEKWKAKQAKVICSQTHYISGADCRFSKWRGTQVASHLPSETARLVRGNTFP